jgi:LysM repeat protein
MSKKYISIFFVVLALVLGACTRAASTAPQTASTTPQLDLPQPVGTSGMNIIETAGTQTAIATAGLPIPTASGNETQVNVEQPTNTPDPNASSTPLPTPTTGAAVVNTPVPQPIVQTSKPAAYTLHEGEFPWCIARRFNVDPAELLSLNGLPLDGQTYYAGLALKIPATGGAFPATRSLKAHPAQYTVRVNDTIYSIACEFGDVDPLNIAAVNNLGGAYNLTTGTTIQIP